MGSAVYMRIFLEESRVGCGERQPMLKENEEAYVEIISDDKDSSSPTPRTSRILPSLSDLSCLLKSRYVSMNAY